MATAKKTVFALDSIQSEIEVPEPYRLAEGHTVELTLRAAKELARMDPEQYSAESMLRVLCTEDTYEFIETLPALHGLKVISDLIERFLNPEMLGSLRINSE